MPSSGAPAPSSRGSAPPGATVRDARLRSQGRGSLVRLAVLLVVVAAVAAVAYRTLHDPPAPFRVVEAGSSVSSSDGEGLMGDRRPLRQEPVDPDAGPTGPFLTALHGPGSAVLSSVTLELDRDEPAMRVRQRGSLVDGPTETVDEDGKVVREDPRMRWHGWVAREPRDYANREIVGAPLPWRNAGVRRGVLVRPGERIRLRTRYDVPRSSARRCHTEFFDGGAGWQVLKDGDPVGSDSGATDTGDWEPLRARSGRRDDDRALVRTGQPDRIAFRVGATGCEPGSSSGDLPGLVEP